MSDSLRPYGLSPSRLLCPWDSQGKNTAVGYHFLLQGIFLIQELNSCLLCLLHCRQILYHLSHKGKPCLQYIGILFSSKRSGLGCLVIDGPSLSQHTPCCSGLALNGHDRVREGMVRPWPGPSLLSLHSLIYGSHRGRPPQRCWQDPLHSCNYYSASLVE